jgi:hypothetical protein
MAQPLPTDMPMPRPRRLRLAARDGRRLPGPCSPVGPAAGEEMLLEVEFIGLTEAEQRRALAAFPGGRRFLLKS